MNSEGIISIEEMFGGLTPSNVYQNRRTGENNIEKARAAKAIIYTKNTKNRWNIQQKIIDITDEFNKKSQYVNAATEMQFEFDATLIEAIAEDTQSIILVLVVVFVYGVLFLGAFSPIHCRVVLTLTGLTTVFASVYAGFGMSYMLGYSAETFHEVLYVLLMGVGIDDMFVICNALD